AGWSAGTARRAREDRDGSCSHQSMPISLARSTDATSSRIWMVSSSMSSRFTLMSPTTTMPLSRIRSRRSARLADGACPARDAGERAHESEGSVIGFTFRVRAAAARATPPPVRRPAARRSPRPRAPRRRRQPASDQHGVVVLLLGPPLEQPHRSRLFFGIPGYPGFNPKTGAADLPDCREPELLEQGGVSADFHSANRPSVRSAAFVAQDAVAPPGHGGL